MELVCNEDIKKLLIIAPPGSAKTTWLVSAYLGCRIGFWPEQSVIIGSVSDEVAEKRSLSLRNMTENPLWRSIFPDVERDESLKWEQKEWSIKPKGKNTPGRLHPSVRSYGTGASIIGSRADFLLGDDLLNFDNSRTQTMRDVVSSWFHNSFLSRRKNGTGRVVLIGNSWNAADLYADIRRNSHGWVICHMPLLSEREDGFFINITYPDDWNGAMLGEPAGEAMV